MSSPAPLFLLFFLLFFLPVPLSFVRPRRRLSPAPTAVLSRPARADGCQGWPLFSGHPLRGPPAFTAIEHDGRLDRSGRLHSCLLFIFIRLRALFRSRMWLLAGLATKSMARAIIASTYIRQLRSGLPRCCLHGRSRRRDGAHLSNGRLASANLRCRPTATHPTCPTHPTGGCRNSAHCRRYRVRVAPCGTRPCSR